jgi:SAM-dependent methyltransferase
MSAAAVNTLPRGATVADRLACPACSGVMRLSDDAVHCAGCGRRYPMRRGGVMDLRPDAATGKQEAIDWSEHWSEEKQATAAQRFFSVYRYAVFARTVRYFTSRYFAGSGVFVEAGSGTAETSSRIDKRNGGRVLVAMDLIPEVLERCHPAMDLRLSGDIFQMPFQDASLDGIWNVGVMEHFTHDQIDRILREFHRTLKPGGRVILLWPAIFSIPQRMLRVVEWGIHRTTENKTFRFHPDEISQIRSVRQGREVLQRNGFRPVRIDPGVHSLMAFETIVGEKHPNS